MNIINWIYANWEAVSAMIVGIYTVVARLYPTNKNVDAIGKLISKYIPNNKVGGGTH